MKLIALPDLHYSGIRHFGQIAGPLASADYVMLVGDLTNGGQANAIQEVIDEVKQYNSSVLAVPGNWDRQEAVEHLSLLGLSLHRTHRMIDGIAFVGVGGALAHYHFSMPTKWTEYTEDQFERFLDEAYQGIPPETPTILISHEPPYDTILDLTSSRKHVGSKAVRAYIERTQPMLCLCGHIHEGTGIDTIGRTQIVNPGPINDGGYGIIEVDTSGVHRLEIGHIHKRR